MSAIYLITGIMAAGKSTVAELLARRFERGVHLRGDVFRKMVVAGREDMSAHPSDEAFRQLNLRYDLAAQAAQGYFDAGFDVVMQDVMIGRVLPEVVARIVRRPLHLIVLCPDPKIVTLREASREKAGYSLGFTPENMHHTLVTETPRIGLWLDTSNMNAEQAANTILLRTCKGEGAIP